LPLSSDGKHTKEKLPLTFFEKKVRPKNLNFKHMLLYSSKLSKVLKFMAMLPLFIDKLFFY